MSVQLMTFPDSIHTLIAIIQTSPSGIETIPQLMIGHTLIPCIAAETTEGISAIKKWIEILQHQEPRSSFTLVLFHRPRG